MTKIKAHIKAKSPKSTLAINKVAGQKNKSPAFKATAEVKSTPNKSVKQKFKAPGFEAGAELTTNPKMSKENNWVFGSLFDSDLTRDMKDYMNSFAGLINNSVYGTMYTNQDFTKQTRQSWQSLSSGIGKSIEQNMHLGQDFLKCQTASDVIELQKKLFEVNFGNMVKLYSDISHSCQNLTTECYKHSAYFADKSMKCFIH